eukprot:2936261-Prymnesium_polylepis.1
MLLGGRTTATMPLSRVLNTTFTRRGSSNLGSDHRGSNEQSSSVDNRVTIGGGFWNTSFTLCATLSRRSTISRVSQGNGSSDVSRREQRHSVEGVRPGAQARSSSVELACASPPASSSPPPARSSPPAAASSPP